MTRGRFVEKYGVPNPNKQSDDMRSCMITSHRVHTHIVHYHHVD